MGFQAVAATLCGQGLELVLPVQVVQAAVQQCRVPEQQRGTGMGRGLCPAESPVPLVLRAAQRSGLLALVPSRRVLPVQELPLALPVGKHPVPQAGVSALLPQEVRQHQQPGL